MEHICIDNTIENYLEIKTYLLNFKEKVWKQLTSLVISTIAENDWHNPNTTWKSV